MKKSILAALLSLTCTLSFAQLQVQTKKYKIADFTEKTMKVVMTGNPLLDVSLRDELQRIWNISTYEFCDMAEFQASKKNDDLYFMLLTEASFRKDRQAGVRCFTIYKGNSEAGENVDGLYEVIAIPFCGTEDINASHLTFLPAILTILQDQLEGFTRKDFIPNTMVRASGNVGVKKWEEKVLIARNNLSFTPDDRMLERMAATNIELCDSDRVDDALASREGGYIAGYVAGDREDANGSSCYVMLINTATWELYYIAHRNVNIKNPAGFSSTDVNLIMQHNPLRK